MRERIAEWKRVYEEDDNCISNALSQMAWDLAAFSCVVEMVRAAPEVDGEKRLNGMVLDLLGRGFWSNTMQAVRRLVEKEAIRGERGVCSLGALVADARACRLRLTRSVFVCEIAGLEYNHRVTQAAEDEWGNQQVRQGNNGFWIPREYHYEPSMQRHAEFDWLAGTTPGASHPKDIIRAEVFDMLDARLARLSDVIEHVNVHIAHAATEASREGRVLERWGLVEAKQALRDIAEIAHVVGNWFCFSSVGTVLPTPQFDQLAHLDAALFTGDLAQLRAVWDEFSNDAHEWHQVDPRQWEADVEANCENAGDPPC